MAKSSVRSITVWSYAFVVDEQEVESRVLPVLMATAAAADLQDMFCCFVALCHTRHRRGAAAVEGQAPAQR
jgi:hypothetical protein